MADPAVAPPPWKGTLFINHGTSNTGWSETYYINTASLTTAQTNFGLILAGRMTLLTNKYSLVYARLSDMSFKGDGYVTTSTLPIVGGFVPLVADGGQPGSCIVTRWNDGAGRRNIHVLHGIPEEDITDGTIALTTPYGALLSAFYTQLITNAAFRRKKAVAPFVEFVPIASIATRYATVKKVGRPFGLLRGRAALRT